jgi:aryl-phospho-beta-D-glucosidase BglC (GH1 family)
MDPRTLRVTGILAVLAGAWVGACGGSSSESPGSEAGTANDGSGASSGSTSEGGSAPGDDGGGGGSSGSSSSSGGNLADSSGEAASPDGGGDAGSASGLHVVLGTGGNPGHIVDGAGQPVAIHGADRSGTEYACIQGWGIFDGPSDQASIDTMKTWKVNAVRVPLNEDCWLGINGVASAYGGANYQQAIASYVNLLTSSGMIVILDLHWAAPGTQTATQQLGMADADHSPTFWSQVATAYANSPSVVFDLFNEPFITDWTCWVSGGSCAQDKNNAAYTTAGMASLLKAVRTAGANNVVIMGGLGYSSDFSQWESSVNGIPNLPAPLDGISIANVAASWHQYDFGNTGCPSQYNGYSTSQHCDTAQMTAMNASIPGVLSAGFPVVIGESGISAYTATPPFSMTQVQDLESWFDDFLTWAEGEGQGYLAWDWNTSGQPYLLTSYDGGATPAFGVTYRAHIAKY